MGMIITGVALAAMFVWFWSVNTSPGLILTAEQQNAAEIAAREEAEAESAAEQDRTQADLDREAESKARGGNGAAKSETPPAPAVTDVATDEVELTTYSILAVNGLLNVGGQLENITASPVSGTVRAYVYIDGVPVATARTEVSGLQPGESTKVNLVSDSEYESGEKVLQLDFEPRR